MVKDNTNPFVLPGFGQSGDAAQNPLVASMEMMRSAWEGLAKVGGFEQVLGSNTSAQDLEKRIADLRAVEQWLRMNLSMLSSTIQALEVQQATVSTLNSFLSSVSANPSDSSVPPSPLEVALGIRPSLDGSATPFSAAPEPAPKTEEPPKPKPETPKADPQPAKPASGDSTGLFANPTETIQQASEAVQAAQQAQIEQAVQATQVAEDATKRWWGLLQNQFDTLAEAAAATVQGVSQPISPDTTKSAVPKKATSAKATAPKAPAKKATAKKASKKVSTAKATTTKAAPAKATKKPTAKAAVKAVAKKSVAKAAVAKKASAKKATTKKSTSKTTKA